MDFKVKLWLAVVVLASFVLICNSVIVKFMDKLSASQLSLIRYFGMLSINFPFLIYRHRGEIYNKEHILKLLARGILGSGSLYLSYLSVKFMPIAESSLLICTTPIWVTVISKICLKENIGVINSISIILCTLGLLCMSRVVNFGGTLIASGGTYWYGFTTAVASAVLVAFAYVFMRSLRGLNETVTITYHSAIGVIFMLAIMLLSNGFALPKCGKDGVFLIVLSCFSYAGQIMLTRALRHEKAGTVAIVRFSSKVFFAFLWQITLFREIPDVYSILAAVLVLASLILSTVGKYLNEIRREKARIKELPVEQIDLDAKI